MNCIQNTYKAASKSPSNRYLTVPQLSELIIVPTGKSKKVVHFGSELQAEGSDRSRCSEEGESQDSNTGSRGSVASYNPAAYLEYVGLASKL